MRNLLAILVFLSVIPVLSTGAPVRAVDPKTFRLAPGLALELWAAEPDVVDPVAMCFDERGTAFVVEMRDYPLGCGPEHKPCGTVRMLEDTDGDGHPDKVSLFAENLSFPTSITPWRGGVLVTAPPQVVWLRDADGDGRAEVREVILEGFRLGVTDSNVNGLRLGLDGWVHGVNGGNGGSLTSPKRPGESLALRHYDFRFNPDTGEVETTFQSSGGFGLVFDNWGRSFSTYNIDHIQQRILSRRHAERYPGFPAVPLTQSISDHEEMAVIYPASRPATRPNHPEQAGRFSSAGGMGYIGAPGYPADMPGSVLVCDVVGNLVHRDVLAPDGPIFRASRSTNELKSEFLASTDPAFRPVGVEVGPDGALYVIDMQRDVIEHPDYIPEKLKAKMNLRAGEDRGRIYRLTPERGLPAVKPRLDSAPNVELVAQLGNPNQWWRLTSQRLLLERKAVEVTPLLRKLARGVALRSEDIRYEGYVVGRTTQIEGIGNPMARVHSLWTLMGLGKLEDADVIAPLADGDAGIRENAAQVAEAFLPGSTLLRQPVVKLAFDASPRVRFQAALALGQLPTTEGLSGLQRVLRTDVNWKWSRLAVWSSLGRDVRTIVNTMLVDRSWLDSRSQARVEVWRELTELIGARASQSPADVSFVLSRVDAAFSERVRIAIAEGFAAGLAASGVRPEMTPSALDGLKQMSMGPTRESIRAAWRLTRTLGLPENEAQLKALDAALKGAGERGRKLEERVTDLRLLEFGTADRVTNRVVGLLDAREPAEIQQGALELLRKLDSPGIGAALVARWPEIGPSARPRALQILLDRRAFHDALLSALEQRQLSAGELNLDLEQRRRLLRGGSEDTRARAARFFSDEEYGNRKQVVSEWLSRLPPDGDPGKGKVIFEAFCASCHIAGGIGNRVGPDLAAVSHRSVEDLVSNILDPNMAINPAYTAYEAETKSGETETGVLAAENSAAVTLVQSGGRKVVLPRSTLVRLRATGLSLMPEGLEQGRTPQEIRDLVTFLQAGN